MLETYYSMCNMRIEYVLCMDKATTIIIWQLSVVHVGNLFAHVYSIIEFICHVIHPCLTTPTYFL